MDREPCPDCKGQGTQTPESPATGCPSCYGTGLLPRPPATLGESVELQQTEAAYFARGTMRERAILKAQMAAAIAGGIAAKQFPGDGAREVQAICALELAELLLRGCAL
jgi:hypothetical protein